MSNLRYHLLAGTVLASLFVTVFATPAGAQTTGGAPASAETPPDETSQEIVVTGTLIANPNLERSTPVNVTSSEELQLRQTNVAEQILREVPGIVPNIGSAVNNGNAGASLVDLRGLDSNRNLVLLDGKRITPAGLFGAVDLNNIPLALIERVDVTTGGQVTTYGADAITGVVNFVTRRNFSGLEQQLSQQITERGDGNVFRSDTTIGVNLDDGRGNAVLSLGYQEADPVYQGDRSFSSTNYGSFDGAVGGSGTTTPSTFTNVVPTSPTARRQIDPATGLAGAVTPFNFNPFNIFQTPFRRYNAFAQARYEVADDIEAYGRALFSKNVVKTIIAPSGVFSSDVLINLNNPYLPAGLRGQFCSTADFDAATPGVQTLSAAQCAAAAAATGPTDPNYRTVATNLRRRTPEVGPRISDFQTTVFDFRAGVRGKITDKIAWDVNGSYGESDRPQTLQNYVLTSRVRQALLANTTAACIDTSNGCVPFNAFGPTGSITPAMAGFLTGESTSTVRTSLAQVSATVSGELGFKIPSADQPISFAIGTEYRKYGAQQRSDSLSKTPGELGGAGGAAPDITGGYKVWEALGELVVPVVAGKPFFESLTIEAGARYSKYTVEAPGNPSFDAFTWKAGGSWEPVAGLKVRGNYSRAVRAPNILELFQPRTVGLANLSFDPCSGAAPVGNANLRAVCLAQGAPALSIGAIANPSAAQANTTIQGSTSLRTEKADTFTVGVVATPFQGFSASIDYYQIVVNNAITAPTPQDAILACFGNVTASSATDPACSVIRRNPTTGALDGDPATTGGLFQPTTNSGRLFTKGIDATLTYRRDVGFAKLSLAANGNYTFSSKFKSLPSAQAIDRECVGYFSVNCSFTGSLQPKFQWSVRGTAGFEGVDVSVLWRHIASFRQEPLDVSSVFGNGAAFKGTLTGGPLAGQSVDFTRIPAYDYIDLAVRFAITDRLGLTLTAINLFDRQPPLTGSTIGSTSFNSGNTYPSTYDALGRRFAAQVRLKF
jgi:iron complex outermembrane recepter protein